jgi:hypothetical protein
MLDLNIPVPIPIITRATAKSPIIPLIEHGHRYNDKQTLAILRVVIVVWLT